MTVSMIDILLIVVPCMILVLCMSVLIHQCHRYRIENGGEVYVGMYDDVNREYETETSLMEMIGIFNFGSIFNTTNSTVIIYADTCDDGDSTEYSDGYIHDVRIDPQGRMVSTTTPLPSPKSKDR